jgi:hypothetical protein
MGRAIAEGSEADILGKLMKYWPYVEFDAEPVLTIYQVIESTNKAMAVAKSK